MKLPYTLKAVNLMTGPNVLRQKGRTVSLDELPVYDDIDMMSVERQLAYVDGAGDMIEFCEGDEPTQQAIAEDCNAHDAHEYLNRAFVTVTS